jgi:1-acyl-sn-glycerol-3-phosphate acyltransferase
MKKICKLIFFICGWRIEGKAPDIKKFLIVAAPHTSAWDFPIGKIALTILGLQGKFLIKQEYFKYWLPRVILKGLGAIPVNRKNRSAIATAIEYFNTHQKCTMIVTPEATRKLQQRWKTGCIEISLGANIPIVIVYLNYAEKFVGIREKLFLPSNGDARVEIEKIENIYLGLDAVAKYPLQYNLSPESIRAQESK